MPSKRAIVPLPERGTRSMISVTSLGMPIYESGFASQAEIVLESPLALNSSIHTNMDAIYGNTSITRFNPSFAPSKKAVVHFHLFDNANDDKRNEQNRQYVRAYVHFAPRRNFLL